MCNFVIHHALNLMGQFLHKIRLAFPEWKMNRYIILLGFVLIVQSLCLYLPVLLSTEVLWSFTVFASLSVLIGIAATVVPKLFSNAQNFQVLPFIGIASCTLPFTMEAVNPGNLIFFAPWILAVTLGERRSYYRMHYLIIFLIFAMGALAFGVLYLPNRSFFFWEFLISFTGGAILSMLLIFLIYMEFISPGKPSEMTIKNSKHALLEKTISRILKSENTLEKTLWQISQRCIPLLDIEDCVIYLYDKESDKLIQMAAYGDKTPDGSEIVLSPIEISPGHGVVGDCFLSGEIKRIPELAKYEGYIIDDKVRNSELAVPIFSKGNVVGVIDSEHSQKAFFTENHVNDFQLLAKLCEAKIDDHKRD